MYSESSEREGLSGVVVDHEDLCVQDHVVTVDEGLRDEVLEVGHLVAHDRLQTSREILELVPLLVKLHSLAVVLDF